MIRSDLERLRDAREFACYAQDNAAGLTPRTLAEAIQAQHTALYDLAVVGETLNKVAAGIKSSAPEVECREFYDLRNFIVHAYWQIDLEIVADVIKNRPDPLIAELDTLISLVERVER
ncbi:MAG: HepT-like ribonuclease domain-containing protein [Xanthobacteraceae bacterium]